MLGLELLLDRSTNLGWTISALVAVPSLKKKRAILSFCMGKNNYRCSLPLCRSCNICLFSSRSFPRCIYQLPEGKVLSLTKVKL